MNFTILPPEVVGNHIFSYLYLREIGRFVFALGNCSFSSQIFKEYIVHCFRYLAVESVQYRSIGSNYRKQLISWFIAHQVSIKSIEYLPLDDASLLSLLKSCLELKKLHLGYQHSVTDQSLCELPKFSKLMESVVLVGGVGISHRSVVELSKYCSMLKHIILNSVRVDDFSIQCLAKGCIFLESFVIWNNLEVSDEGMEALFLSCVRLRHVVLKDVPAITDCSLDKLAECCVELECVELFLLPQVSLEAVQNVLTRCRKLAAVFAYACTPHKLRATQLQQYRPEADVRVPVDYFDEVYEYATHPHFTQMFYYDASAKQYRYYYDRESEE